MRQLCCHRNGRALIHTKADQHEERRPRSRGRRAPDQGGRVPFGDRGGARGEGGDLPGDGLQPLWLEARRAGGARRRCFTGPEMRAINAALELEDPVAALEAMIEPSCALWEARGFIVEQLSAIVVLEPGAAALIDEIEADQRSGLQALTRRLARAGRLRPGLGQARRPRRCTCSPASNPSCACGAPTASRCAKPARRSPSWPSRCSATRPAGEQVAAHS